jgi:flagellar biosynthesis/type III secretory pathway protein FliH
VVKETILFRVLTEEEARTVKRWQAPSLTVSASVNGGDSDQPETIVGSLTRHREALIDHVDDDKSVTAADTPTDTADSAVSKTKNTLPANPSAEMLQTSYDEGYAQGFAEGSAAAHQQSGDEISALLNNLLHQQLAQDARLADEILLLAKAMARLLVHREIRDDATVLEGIVQSALGRLDAKTDGASIHVNPLDAAQLAMLLPEDLSKSLVADAALSRGDCVIESAGSTVRSGVNELIDSLIVDMDSLQESDAGSRGSDASSTGNADSSNKPGDEDIP